MGITESLKVLSDPQRQRILLLLKQGKMNAGAIAEALDISPAALSYHLRLLKKDEFVLEYREKNFIWYEINTTIFDELILWVGQFKIEKGDDIYAEKHTAK